MIKEIKQVLKDYKTRGLFIDDAVHELISIFENYKKSKDNK